MLTELINKQSISPICDKKYKGKVTVQLFDAKTGKLEKEAKGENMVTDAVAKIFASNYFGTLLYPQLMPIAKHMFGGILCFNQTNTENAGNVYVPNGNAITAHAGQSNEYYLTDQDSTKGTVNTTESGVIAGGYRHVWNFETTQGNGRISSLSLTHKDFGDFAFHDVYIINNQRTPLFQPFEDFSYGNNLYGLGSSQTNRSPLLWNLVDKVAYKLVADGTTLTVWDLKSYGILENIGLAEDPPLETLQTNAFNHTHTFTMPQNAQLMRYMLVKIVANEFDSTATYLEGAKTYYEGYLYKANTAISTPEEWNDQHWDRQNCYELHCLYPSGSGDNNVVRRIINLTSFEMTTSNFTVSGASFLAPDNIYNPHGECYPTSLDVDGYMYVVGENLRIYKFSYSNPADVSYVEYEEISGQDTTTSLRKSLIGVGHCGVSAAAGIIVSGTNCIPCKRGDRFRWQWNEQNHIRLSEIDNQLVFYAPLADPDRQIVGGGITSVINKMYLATIFNLSEPIEKAATNSMKITYEITEVEDEET